jgi:dipeptidyl aminopeptidase/acylaminoacyl peptidase
MSQPDLIPIDVLFGNPAVAGAALSPDGNRVAYLAPDEGVLNLWVGTVGGDDGRPVTADRGRGVQEFRWAQDDRHILFLQDRGGDENWRIYTVDLETGAIADRTPVDGVQARLLAASKDKPNEVLVGLNASDPRYHDVHRLDLTTGELEKVCENPGFEDWLIDHDHVVRGASRPRADGGVDYVVPDGDDWRVAFSVEPDDFVINITYPLGFLADNRRLLMTSAAGSNTARLVSVDIETGVRQDIAGDPDYDLYGIAFPGLNPVVLHPDTYEPQLLVWFKDRADYRVLDDDIADDVARVRSAARGDVGIASRDRTGDHWLVYDVIDSGSARFSAYDRNTKNLTPLFDERPDLADYTLAAMEPFAFDARDGMRVHGYVTLPPGEARENLPAVLHVHGGPWGARHFWGFDPTAQWLANRGYACVEVDYRGSGGYGKAFLNASAQEWAGAMHDDLLDGLDHLIGLGWIDRDRMAIFGGSYGGYAALVGATFTPDVFRCAVDYVGPSNLITLLESIPPYWFGVATQFDKLLGNPERDRDFLWSRSPLSRVDDIRIPLLIAQGANDPRVKQAESEQIVAALRERGVEHEYLLFEDEGHGFVRPENRTAFFLAAERFLAKYLGGRAQD